MSNRLIAQWLLVLMLIASSVATATPSGEAEEFLAKAFPAGVPAPELLWLTAERKSAATEILGHRPGAMRVRYWQHEGYTAWILEEIGKEELITVGLLVADDGIRRLRVLAYRESRGGEVRHEYFTRQFDQAQLSSKLKLDRKIDGVSGATLSVRALTRVVRLALYYHSQLRFQ